MNWRRSPIKTMIVKFPDLDTLQLALTSGAIPAEVAQKAAVAGFGDEDQLWVETSARLSAAVQKELKRLGAVVCKASGAALSTEVSCWLELLPLVPDDTPVEALEQTPVLFDVPRGDELTRLVLEMLRLGNDRQSFRWLESPAAKNGDDRALLRVVGPPYYSLLRAIDQLGGPGVAPHAFVERVPGVWIEVGQRHPLADAIRPPKNKILLLRPPRHWSVLPDAPFRDLYEMIEFQLPDGGTRWRDEALPNRLHVAPRLRPAGPAEGAELWVLRGEAIDELNRFVQNAEDALLARLAFAIGEKNGQRIAVLRVRPSKLPPPVVILPAEAYKSYLRLPNLFLPAGFSLHPPLRRDVVRKLLAEDVTRITWLAPGENGVFTPESLLEDVFRPLTDWVDYVLDRDNEPLQAWVQAMRFEFEPFVCDEETPPKPKKPPADEKARGPRRGAAPNVTADAAGKGGASETPEEAPDAEDETEALDAFAAVEKVEPGELEKQLRSVEEDFLTLPGTLDDDAHRALWPRLADLNARLRKTEDAGLCWLNALWEPGESANGSAARWAAAWFRTESAAQGREVQRDLSGENLDRLLAKQEPSGSDMRVLASFLTWSSYRSPRPAALMSRLQAIQRFLEKNEKLLPVRACWLAWYYLAELIGGDELALARARDRLLERLFHNGLRPEQDLPSFLRFAGQPTSQRFRDVREWLGRLHERALEWVEKHPSMLIVTNAQAQTEAYVDLIFAFGFARLGEQDKSQRLQKRAETALSGGPEAHRLLFQSFRHRIQQALDGEPCRGPLPAAITEQLEPLRKARKENEPDQVYVVDSLRSISRILEPEQRMDPYRHVQAKDGEWERLAAEAPDITDRNELSNRLLALLKIVPRGAQSQDRIKALRLALEQAPRIGEGFARSMLDQALAAYDSVPEDAEPALLQDRGELLEKALFVAAHFDRVEHIQALLSRFKKLFQTGSPALLMNDLEKLILHCFRGLRKLGMRDEINQLLLRITAALLKGKDIASLDRREMADNPDILRSLLQIAAGWYYFGRDEQAQAVVRLAREVLYKHTMLPLPRTRLACTYAATLGQAPVEVAKNGLEELFERLDGLVNMRGMSSFYNQLQLRVIEAALLAVVSDDFTQGTQARRWLDDDEFLVRRRIHEDVRHLLARS